MSRCIAGRNRNCLAESMRILHLNTKQVELVRVLFSISMTVFVAVGWFLALRYLTGSPV